MGKMKKKVKKSKKEEIIKGLIEKLEKEKPEIIPGEGSSERLRKMRSLKTLDEKPDYVGRIGAIRMMREGTFDFTPYINEHNKKLLQNSLDIMEAKEKEKKKFKSKNIDLSKFDKSKRIKSCARKCDEPLHPDACSFEPINWELLEDLNSKKIFNSDDERRETMLFILSKNINKKANLQTDMEKRIKKTQKALKKSLTKEFMRLYTRYRKMVLREEGKKRPVYGVLKKEEKYATFAAMNCLTKGVTPRQVFEYWHENISNFANCTLVIPSLAFLSSSANIDTVAISLMAEGGVKKKKKRKKVTVNTVNPMSDVSKLDKRLRPALMKAGFDLSDKNDKYLIFVQAHAIGVVKGVEEMKTTPTATRRMVKWAAENFYNRIKDLDAYR
jgi:hypothetical protein